MQRLVLIGALLGGAAGACGVPDDRPRNLEYITQTILAPTCAAAECHSAFKREVGDEFDTVDAARRSIVNNELVDMLDPPSSVLYGAITRGEPSILSPGSGNVRMPFDAPMPDADVELILRWIEDGAPGAQCLPNDQGNGCLVTGTPGAPVFQVVQCVDGNAVSVVMTCPGKQVCLAFNGNGQCTGQQ
ncbi:MAG TPA: hypothetical protein VHT91_45210 [Kofleriaceae bacterium]|jgi:hypothetical protein|nr:hypothetical protein [Kofleriaceae bacterium]